MIRESQIIFEEGKIWILDTKDSYSVQISGFTHSTTDSAYHRNSDGLSIAMARAKYLVKRFNEGKLKCFQ